jgi:hypothetical protein
MVLEVFAPTPSNAATILLEPQRYLALYGHRHVDTLHVHQHSAR